MSSSGQTSAGWIIFISALGMMCGLLAIDIAQLPSFDQAVTPRFVGAFLGHLAAVIAAFVGGKIIPDDRDNKMTRSTDNQVTIK